MSKKTKQQSPNFHDENEVHNPALLHPLLFLPPPSLYIKSSGKKKFQSNQWPPFQTSSFLSKKRKETEEAAGVRAPWSRKAARETTAAQGMGLFQGHHWS